MNPIAPQQSTERERRLLSKLMIASRNNKGQERVHEQCKSFIVSAMEKSVSTATKWREVLQVPVSLAKKIHLTNLLPSKSRPNDLLPAAQLRIAFSGASQSCAATENGVRKSTVRYIRKAAAHIYTELQAKLVCETAAGMTSSRCAPQIHCMPIYLPRNLQVA